MNTAYNEISPNPSGAMSTSRRWVSKRNVLVVLMAAVALLGVVTVGSYFVPNNPSVTRMSTMEDPSRVFHMAAGTKATTNMNTNMNMRMNMNMNPSTTRARSSVTDAQMLSRFQQTRDVSRYSTSSPGYARALMSARGSATSRAARTARTARTARAQAQAPGLGYNPQQLSRSMYMRPPVSADSHNARLMTLDEVHRKMRAVNPSDQQMMAPAPAAAPARQGAPARAYRGGYRM